MNKKTITIIIISVIVVILAIIGIVAFANSSKNNNGNITNKENSKVIEIYQKISQNPVYTFTKTLDENNSTKTVINKNNAYKEELTNGTTNKYIVKEGNTYLLVESSKKYFAYQNNDIILSEISSVFETAQSAGYVTGKEEIDGKKYYYEEFLNVDGLAFDTNLVGTDEENAKTRFYFDGNNLKYIKTILGEKEEVIKVNISYDANDGIFNIPSEYENGMQE